MSRENICEFHSDGKWSAGILRFVNWPGIGLSWPRLWSTKSSANMCCSYNKKLSDLLLDHWVFLHRSQPQSTTVNLKNKF